ncbi:MAG: hypothetical protein QNK63_00605, partial [Flavobacteriales bacterium]
MKKLFAFILLIFTILFTTEALSQTTFTGVISSDWHTEGNWDNGFPGPGNDATIQIESNVIISDGLDIDYTLHNEGDIEINEVSLVITGTIENIGNISAYGTALIEIQPSGSINNLSGVISNFASIYNAGFIYNDGFIDNEGYFLIHDSGAVVNEPTGFIDNSGEVFNDGAVDNFGLINQCGLWNGSDPIGNPLETAACQNEIDCTLYECDCADGIDNEGDGLIDCDDPDCASAPECVDCIAYECDCADGIDNDGDGQIDCNDSDCASASECVDCTLYECDCADGIDNEGDGLIDCDDPDCASNPSCSEGIGGTTFTGVISSDWHTEGNWDNGFPGPGNDATIPIGSNVIISDGLDIDYNLFNEGNIEINEVSIVVTGTIENFGNISAYGTAIIEIQPSGSINNLSGVISNYASIENFGFIYNDGFIDNEGYFFIHDSGTIVNEPTGSVDNNGDVINLGVVENLGVINQCGMWQGLDPNFNPYTTENCDPNLGCTDMTACNFNAQATIDNGFCTYPGCNNVAACNYNLFAGCDDESCVLPDGCTDLTACNYDSAATCDDGLCTYPGCADAAACNYDFAAGCDDGSCVFPDGCTDLTACNYDPAAGCDDGSCVFPDGCTDSTACTYDSAAICDDGLCTYPGCADSIACNFDPTAGCDDGSCYYCSCAGPSLVSFNYEFDYYVAEASANIYDEAGNLIANLMYVEDGSLIVADGEFPDDLDFGAMGADPELEGYYLTGQTISLAEGTYTLELLDSFGDGWIWENVYGGVQVDSPEGLLLELDWDDSNAGDVLTGTFNVLGGPINSACGCMDPIACNFDPDALYDDDSCQLINGCIDSTACNYDSAATCDDGSCEFISCNSGCTYPSATNYNSGVTIDDGTCVFECPDITSDNQDAYDAGAASICPGDFSGDGNVNVSDLGGFLGAFGTPCSTSTLLGCTDSAASNYNPLANTDDGACEYDSDEIERINFDIKNINFTQVGEAYQVSVTLTEPIISPQGADIGLTVNLASSAPSVSITPTTLYWDSENWQDTRVFTIEVVTE